MISEPSSLQIPSIGKCFFASWHFKHWAKDSDLMPWLHFPFGDITFPTQDMTCPQPLSRNHEQRNLVETERQRHPATGWQSEARLIMPLGRVEGDYVGSNVLFSLCSDPNSLAETLTANTVGFLYPALSPGPNHGSGCLAQCLSQKICKDLFNLALPLKAWPAATLETRLMTKWNFPNYSINWLTCRWISLSRTEMSWNLTLANIFLNSIRQTFFGVVMAEKKTC